MDDPLRMTFADFLAARAALAKQLFNGVRLFLVAHQMASKAPPPTPGRDVTPAIEGGKG